MAQEKPTKETTSNPWTTQSWFVKELKSIKPEASELFENYSKIPTENIISHITEIVRISRFRIPFIGSSADICIEKQGFRSGEVTSNSDQFSTQRYPVSIPLPGSLGFP
jgi:hypothetical protein